jgi:hypothetical protein
MHICDPSTGEAKQEDHEFEASLGCIAAQWEPKEGRKEGRKEGGRERGKKDYMV